ncbi:hypothetical protein LCGC14_2472850 [marine sediment metagenome]|uniref:Uncharacterized protein n=1 Tax=marine sediment metagenome TaxID=412755 RepID=A0A0F9B9V5_9ZZZZ
MRTFNEDLEEDLKDPECAAYYANAQAESKRELLRCGAITELDETSGSNKTHEGRDDIT